MASAREFVKARLAMTRQDLDQVLAHLTDVEPRWVPGEGMKTIGDQLLEIANKDIEIVGWLRNGEWPDDETDPFNAETSTLVEKKAGLESTRAATLEYIDSLDEEQLEETLSLPEPWWEALRLLDVLEARCSAISRLTSGITLASLSCTSGCAGTIHTSGPS
ncbi:MAG: DinB family protein [Armatimonadetes bacterium]|nr:DinB family protein [Armatimonadota bacterium]